MDAARSPLVNDPASRAAQFPCRARQWYLVWIWSAVSIYADSGVWGSAISLANMSGNVRFVVFGSL